MSAVNLKKVKRILVIRLKGLGDVVQTLGALRAIKAAYPDVELGFLTSRPFLDVSKMVEDRIRFFGVCKGGNEVLSTLRLLKKIRKFKPDLVIDLFCNPRSALLTFLSGAKYRFGFHYRGRHWFYNLRKKIENPDLHIQDLFLQVLHFAGLKKARPWQNSLRLPEEARPAFERARDLKGIKVAINCNAAYQAKRWLMEHFVKLTERLLTEGYRVVLLNGPGEEDYTARLADHFKDREGLTWFKNPTLLDYFAILKAMDLFITNDSGPMHMAEAMGTPIYTFFGPTNPRANGPRGPKDIIFRADHLPCLTCHLEYCSHQKCMVELPPHLVFDKIRQNFPSR